MRGARSVGAAIAAACALATVACGAAHAAPGELEIRAEVNRDRIRDGEAVRLKVTATGPDVRSAEGPEFPDDFPFDVASTGTSSSFSWINGKSSQTIEWTFNLLPLKTGTLAIGPIVLRSGGRRFATDPLTVRVLPAPGASGGGVPSLAQPAPPAKARGAVFLRTSATPARAYVGQQIVYSSEIYAYQRFFRRPSHSFPDFVGFVVEEVPERPPARSVVVEGRSYVLEQIQLALFPTKPGTFTLDRPSLSYERDPFFARSETVYGDPVTIEIVALPAGAPAGFDGAVGRFEIAAAVDGREFTAGRPVTVTVTVEGEGNVKAIREPGRPDLGAFKLYESKASEKVYDSPAPLGGRKTFEYLLIPPQAGTFEIGAFSFSFFDPAAERYRTVRTEPIRLEVAAAAHTPGDVAWSARTPSLSAGTDVRPLMLTGDLDGGAAAVPAGAAFAALVLAPWLVAGGVLGVRLVRRRVIDNPAVFGAQRLRARARAGLGRARAELDGGRREDFYLALSGALVDYLAERCGRKGEALTPAELAPLLEAAGCPAPVRAEIDALLREAEMAKFAPGAAGASDARAAFERAEKVVEAW